MIGKHSNPQNRTKTSQKIGLSVILVYCCPILQIQHQVDIPENSLSATTLAVAVVISEDLMCSCYSTELGRLELV